MSTQDKKPDNEPAIWYRYEDIRVAGPMNEWGETAPGHVELRLSTFRVSKTTPKGVWLAPSFYGDPHFVLKESRKQYASPTKELALEAFVARKTRQARILRAQLKGVESAIHLANQLRGVAPDNNKDKLDFCTDLGMT